MKPRSIHKRKNLIKSGTLNPHADQVTDPMFQKHDFFDADDLLQVKYEMLRRVEKERQKVTTVTSQFGFSRRHFYELQKQFSVAGLHGLLPEKRGPRGAHKLNGEIMAFIGEQIDQDSRVNASELAARIKERFGIRVHPRSIERAVERKKKGSSP